MAACICLSKTASTGLLAIRLSRRAAAPVTGSGSVPEMVTGRLSSRLSRRLKATSSGLRFCSNRAISVFTSSIMMSARMGSTMGAIPCWNMTVASSLSVSSNRNRSCWMRICSSSSNRGYQPFFTLKNSSFCATCTAWSFTSAIRAASFSMASSAPNQGNICIAEMLPNWLPIGNIMGRTNQEAFTVGSGSAFACGSFCRAACTSVCFARMPGLFSAAIFR